MRRERRDIVLGGGFLYLFGCCFFFFEGVDVIVTGVVDVGLGHGWVLFEKRNSVVGAENDAPILSVVLISDWEARTEAKLLNVDCGLFHLCHAGLMWANGGMGAIDRWARTMK